MNTTKYALADAAIAAYETALFAAVGRMNESTENRLALLEFYAIEACTAAARDRSVNQFTRNHYANELAWFKRQTVN